MSNKKPIIGQLGRRRIFDDDADRDNFLKRKEAEQKDQFERRYWLKAQCYAIDRIVQKAAEIFEIAPKQICQPGSHY